VAKGAVGLVAGYYPEDVYRYLAIPGLSVDEGVVVRPARRHAERPALSDGAETLTFQDLARDMERCSAILRTALGDGATRLALLVPGQLQLARLLLGGLRARCLTLLLDPELAPAELARHLDSFQPDLLVAGAGTEAELAQAGQGRWRVVSADDLLSQEAGQPAAPARVDLKARAVGLVGPSGRLVYHSHATLMGWAVSWSAFLPLTEEDVFSSLEPLCRWGGLLTALATLFRGGRCVLSQPRSAAALAELIHESCARYLLLPFSSASELARASSLALRQELSRNVRGVFTTLERPFPVKERRRIESAFDAPVLTLLGNAAAGPALAAHPSWYLDESVGIPVTNVDAWPLYPGTGQPLAVPWEAIDYGELGVRSPMLAADYQTAEDRAEWVQDGWLRMRVTALMDPSGLFYLRPWR